jgi:hypothetical protein
MWAELLSNGQKGLLSRRVARDRLPAMNAVQTYFPDHSFGSQLGTSPVLGTSRVKNPVICKDLVGVGVEPATLGSRD